MEAPLCSAKKLNEILKISADLGQNIATWPPAKVAEAFLKARQGFKTRLEEFLKNENKNEGAQVLNLMIGKPSKKARGDPTYKKKKRKRTRRRKKSKAA